MLHVKGFKAFKKWCSLDLGLCPVLGTAASGSLEDATSPKGAWVGLRRVQRDPAGSE